MDRIHPATWILWGLLMVSILTHWVQWRQIKKLEKEIAPIIIRPHIRIYEKPEEYKIWHCQQLLFQRYAI